jgi:hypothetical protein
MGNYLHRDFLQASMRINAIDNCGRRRCRKRFVGFSTLTTHSHR